MLFQSIECKVLKKKKKFNEDTYKHGTKYRICKLQQFYN